MTKGKLGMDQLDKLPPAALIPFGVVLAIIFAVRFLGLWQGQHTPTSKSQTGATVAAVIVDPTALNRASDELAKTTDALRRIAEIAEDMEKAHLGAARAIEGLREELYIQRELGRRR